MQLKISTPLLVKGLVLLLFLASVPSLAAKKATKKKFSSLSTNINFDDLTVKGKYSTAMEAQAIVEDEKGLNTLLQPRQNFNDRMKASRNRF